MENLKLAGVCWKTNRKRSQLWCWLSI